MAESLNVGSSSTGMSGAFNQMGPGAAGIGSRTENRSLFRLPPPQPISNLPSSSSSPHDSDDPILSTHSRPSGYQDRRRPDSTHSPSAIDERQVMDVGNNIHPTGRKLPARPPWQGPPSYKSFVTRSTPSPIPLPFSYTYGHSVLNPNPQGVPTAKRGIPDLRSTSISNLAAPVEDDGFLPYQDPKSFATSFPRPHRLGSRNNYATGTASGTNANPTSMRMTSHRRWKCIQCCRASFHLHHR